jgi:ketosteroid isomerase-like protein
MRSEGGVEVLRAMFAAYEQRGPSSILEFIAPEVEWNVRPDLPDSKTYRGHDGVRELFATFEEVMDEQWYRPQEFIEAGEHVVVPLRWGGRGKASGAQFEERQETWVFMVRKGKIMHVREYATKGAALEAVGLTEQDARADSS